MKSCDKENAEGAISGTRECAAIPTNEFSMLAYSSGGGSRADASVDWQNSEYCPSQDSGPIFESVGPVFIPYYDFCGSYTITAASLAPYPVKLCSVRSDEYPIPNWTISRNEDNCTLEKSTIAEFMN